MLQLCVCVSPLATPCSKMCVKNTENMQLPLGQALLGVMVPAPCPLNVAAAAAHGRGQREAVGWAGGIGGSHAAAICWHYDFSISIKMPHSNSNSSSNKGNCCCCCNDSNNNNYNCCCCNKCATASLSKKKKKE